MIFIETPVFTRLVKELLEDDAYAAFQRWRKTRQQAMSSRIPVAYARSVSPAVAMANVAALG
ncbi:hypothetical protein J2W58_001155 [Pseudomonas psychrotolerans]|nr:hypothetical protein [Pseudomonas psychrotolerans]